MKENKTKWQKLVDFWNSWTGTIIFVLVFIFFVAQAFTIPSGSMKNTLLIGDHLFVKKFAYGIPTPRIPFLEVPVLPDFKGDGHLLSYAKPKRGDIVVFLYPHNTKLHYVKRCVGLGDDEIIYSNKTLYVRMHEGDEYMKANYPESKQVILQGKLYIKEPFTKKGIHYDERIDFDRVIEAYIAKNQFAMEPIYVSELKGLHKAYYYKVPSNEYFMMGDNRDHSNDSRFWGSVDYKYIEGKPWFVYLSWDEDYNIRWERMFKSVDTLENDERYIHHEVSDINSLD